VFKTHKYKLGAFLSLLEYAERSAHRPILRFITPSNLTVYVGENATLRCEVFSDAHPFIYWKRYLKRNGSSIDPVTNESYFEVIKVLQPRWHGNNNCV